MTNTSLRIVDFALAYARRGWAVLPLHELRHGRCTCKLEECSSQGKHPRTKNGVKDATTDPETIRVWWSTWPAANIGIATGSASGLYIIDIDTVKGATVEPSERCPNDFTGLLSESLSVRTGSGGYHIYLRSDPAFNLRNTAGLLGANIDTRGEGGYVVAPPSYNEHGPYIWFNGRKEIQPIPENLLSELKQSFAYPAPCKETQQGTRKQTARVESEVQEEIKKMLALACAPKQDVSQEARNNYLFRQAGFLRWRGDNVDEIRLRLLEINATRYGNSRHPNGPLSLDELNATIFKSVEKWEAAQAGPEIIPADELLEQETIPISWLVPELLSSGLILLAGKPKMGKSWLTLGLALTCSLGSDAGELVLGRYRAEPSGVLYMALEDGKARLQTRLSRLLNGRAVPKQLHLALNWKPLRTGGLFDLHAYLLDHLQVKLVVIDTLACVRAGGLNSGNMYQEDYDQMRSLKEIVAIHDVAILLVHHTRKMGSDDPFDAISGSNGLQGAADASMVLTREQGQHDATLHIRGRDDEKGEQSLALTFNAQTCAWTCTGDVAERQTSQARQQILDLLRDHEAMTPAEIAKELGKARGTIRTILFRMVQDGLIVKNAYGHYALPGTVSQTSLDIELDGEQAAD